MNSNNNAAFSHERELVATNHERDLAATNHPDNTTQSTTTLLAARNSTSKPQQTAKMDNNKRMMEGLGGPVSLDAYHLDGIDPCLEDCCRREVESNRKHNALTSTLRRHDVAALAERKRRNLVKTPEFEGCRCCYDPNSDGGSYGALMEYYKMKGGNNNALEDDNEVENENPITSGKLFGSTDEKKDVSDSDDDSEFDYLLDEDLPGAESDTLRELEEARRAELEYQILMRQVAGQHGYGVTRQLHPTRVLKAAGLGMGPTNTGRIPPPAVVLHLVDADSKASASLDYYLETELAQENPGTVFLRSGGRSTLLMDATLAQQSLPRSVLDPDRDLPALIAIRDGNVVNACPRLEGLTTSRGSHDDAEVEPHAVRQWLEHCGVLLRDPPNNMHEMCFIRPEEEALMEYLNTNPEHYKVKEEEERYDCGLAGCHKTFKHEHVGIQTSEQSGLVVKEETVLGTTED